MSNYIDNIVKNAVTYDLVSKPLANDMANEFSIQSTYAVGDYVMHDYKLYKCISAVTTAGNWNSAKWQECKIGDEINGGVKFTAQTLTSEQKAQARSNIGGASQADLEALNAVRYDQAQTLTTAQKTQARANIGAVSQEEATPDAIRYSAQSLTDAQKNQARVNVGTVSSTSIADEFSTSTAYAVGDMVMYDSKLYKFKTAHSAGAWNVAQVDAVSVNEEISSLKGDLSDLDGAVFGDEPELIWESGTYSSTAGEPSATDWAIRVSNIPYAIAGTVISAQAIDGATLRVLEMSSPTITDANHVLASNQSNDGPITTSHDAYLRIAVVKQAIPLSDGSKVTYTSPQYLVKTIEQTLTDAQKTRVKANLGITDSSGLTSAAKRALISCFESVAWANTSGRSLCNALMVALGMKTGLTWSYEDGGVPWVVDSSVWEIVSGSYNAPFVQGVGIWCSPNSGGDANANFYPKSYTVSDVCTIEMDVYVATNIDIGGIVLRCGNGTYGCQLQCNSTGVTIDDGSSYVANALSTGRDHNLKIQWNLDGQTKFYVDGTLIASQSTRKSIGSNSNRFMVVHAEPLNNFDVYIKSIRFENNAES